ncbi:uncharacterized protein TNCV_4626701 [Trichonephila clavipes]|nr:uncharacterized protein TNCV_4626701 [Trichonephila clavipes]
MVSFNLAIGAVEPHYLSQCLDPADDIDRVFFHPYQIQRRNPDGCSVFRSEVIAIDEALGSLASLRNGKEIWILSDSRSAIQHLSNWQKLNTRTRPLGLTPEHHWYQCSRPGGSLAHGFTRQDQTLLARFRSGHIKSMKFSEGRKNFEMCTNCSSEPATPAPIL